MSMLTIFLHLGQLSFSTQDACIVLDIILKDGLSLEVVDGHEATHVICCHLCVVHLADLVFEHLIHLLTHVLKGF